MGQAKNGDKVKVHYTGKLDNGKVFDTTQDRDPLEIIIGSGKVIPGFEKGIIGMESGDTKTITIPPEKAYGQRFEDLVLNVKKSDLSQDIKPTIGQKLKVHQTDGKTIDIVVTDMTDEYGNT